MILTGWYCGFSRYYKDFMHTLWSVWHLQKISLQSFHISGICWNATLALVYYTLCISFLWSCNLDIFYRQAIDMVRDLSWYWLVCDQNINLLNAAAVWDLLIKGTEITNAISFWLFTTKTSKYFKILWADFYQLVWSERHN